MGGVKKCVWEQHVESFPELQTTYGKPRLFDFYPWLKREKTLRKLATVYHKYRIIIR